MLRAKRCLACLAVAGTLAMAVPPASAIESPASKLDTRATIEHERARTRMQAMHEQWLLRLERQREENQQRRILDPSARGGGGHAAPARPIR